MALTKIPGFALDRTSNVTFSNLEVTGNLTSGNANLGNLATANFFSGNGSLLTGIDAAGKVANGTSNVSITTSNGNITMGVAGNANIAVITGTGVNVSGTLDVTGNANVGNLSATGIIASTLTSNVATGTAPLTVTSTTKVTNLNADLVDGYTTSLTATANTIVVRDANSNIVGNNISGTLSTASQPNITSVGTLTSLGVTGNITSGNANLGNLVTANFFQGDGGLLSNIGGASYIANGTSNLSVASSGDITASISGNSTLVLTNVGANVNGYANISGTLQLGGNITTPLRVTGNANVGNLNTTGNINANNLTLTGNLVVSGTTTSVNSTVTTIVDPIIELGGGANGELLTSTDNKDRGVMLHRYEGIAGSGGKKVDSFIGWDDSNSEFSFGSNVFITNDVVTVNEFGNVRANMYYGNGSQLTGISATTAISLINGTSNVEVTNNGNVIFGVGGNASIMTVTSTGANVGGYLSVIGNVTAGNTVSANYFIGNGSLLTGLGGLSNGNSNVSIEQNGNIMLSAGGSYSVLIVTSTGTNAAGYLSVSGNLVAANIRSNGFANINGLVTAANANLGNLVNANYFNGTLTSLSGNQPNIVSVGSLTSLTVTGNITSGNANLGNLARANFFQGDGGLLSNIGSPNTVVLGTTNLNIPVTNGNVTITVASTANTVVFTSTGVNIAGYANITGNLTAANANLGNLITANFANIASNLVAGNANLGNLVTANNFTGVFSKGNSNVNIPTSNGNVTISAVGNANVVVVTGTGANITGTANITGNLVAGNANLGNLASATYLEGTLITQNQPNIVSVGSLLNVTVTANANIGGNLYVGNLTSSVMIANTGAIVTTGNITAPNANLGNVVTANFTNAVLTTAAQPNITSVGTLGNLTVTNNVSANTLTTGTGSNANLTINPDGTGQLVIDATTPVVLSGNTLTSNGNVIFTGANISLGSVSNVSITGGSVNQFLKTDGSGNLSWATPAGGGGGGGTSITYTADVAPPGTANIADQWYNTSTNTLYEYMNDGTSSYWIDIQTPTVSSAASSSGTNLLVQNQGSNLTTVANTLNFTGSGVVATNSSSAVTVNIPGGVSAQDLLSPFMLMGS